MRALAILGLGTLTLVAAACGKDKPARGGTPDGGGTFDGGMMGGDDGSRPGDDGGGGDGSLPTEDFCMIARCPTGLDALLTAMPNTYRAANGGPYWDVALPPPAGARCWCVINEFDDFSCTSDADCDESTCDTATSLCRKPGQHTHGPFDVALDPMTADGTGGSRWGDHEGPNCPYHHMHGTFTSPADTGGTTDPPDPDGHGDTCGHGGLVWLGDDGVILGM
jgi:hypothetical protein